MPDFLFLFSASVRVAFKRVKEKNQFFRDYLLGTVSFWALLGYCFPSWIPSNGFLHGLDSSY